MNVPKELFYSRDHEWVRFIDDNTAEVGITDHAQDALGDIVFVNLPEVGDSVSVGDAIADIESVKAVSDVLTPVAGVVSAVNEDIDSDPASINSEPYKAWLFRISEISDKEELLSAAEYEEFLKEEE